MSRLGHWYVSENAERRRGQSPFGSEDDPGFVDGWGLPVWRDEFDYRDSGGNLAVDPTKWSVKNSSTFGQTPDAANITPSAVSILPSEQLRIRGTWRSTPVITSSGVDGNPTERWMDTGYMDHRIGSGGNSASETIFSQQYGRWEIRCTTPTGPNTLGTLAAFWLRCNTTPGEIDIMEAWGFAGNAPTSNGQVPGSSTTTFHSSTMGEPVNGKPYQKSFWRINEELGDYSNMSWSYVSNNLPLHPAYSALHTWAFERTPTYIATYYDGVEAARTTPAQTPWLWDSDFFGSPLHIRLNLHIGMSRTFWGAPDPNNRSITEAPLDYIVDYIRVWSYQS